MAERFLRVVDRAAASAAAATTHVLTPSGAMTGKGEQNLQLERQQRETFIFTLAHELRQPLATLMASVEVLRLRSDDPTTERATSIMKRQIGQMNRVVEDLLDAARWARGKVTLRKQRLDVRDVISEAAQDVAAAVAERGHDLVVTTTSEPLWADVDAQRLHQVLSNLLRNAVKYTDPGGRIDLTTHRQATTMTLCVRDNGRGIEPEAMPHIFELFAQVRPSEAAGVGIGLSVVREIVSLHDGRIDARSEGQGCGSEFVVTLPLASAR
jgi:signal transduction histidine kinase